MNLRQVLQAYIDHRYEVVRRRTEYELAKALARAHLLEGLLIAVDNVDEVVRIIRSSRTREDAAHALMARFELSERQTNAILDMRLHQLTGLAMEELQREYDELMEKITHYRELLASRELILGVIKDELIEVRERHADPRRTTILPSEKELNIEDLIARDICVITISDSDYVKRVPLDVYETQGRGGVGVRGMRTKDEDYVRHLVTACTHDYILFFTSHGRMHWLKAYEIPEGSRTGRGKALVNLVDLEPEECVRAILAVDRVDVEGLFVVMATRLGVVKKTPLRAFRHLRRKGIKAIVLDEGDGLIEAHLTDGRQELLLSSLHGKACRFSENDVRPMGRTSRGVRGMELRDGSGGFVSEVIAMSVVNPEADLLVITQKGMGKKTHLGTGVAEQDRAIKGGYRLTRRGSKGVTSIKLRGDDRVVAALQVNEKDEILISSTVGQMVRIQTDEIAPKGRNSFGVRVMRLREGDEIAGVSLIEELEELEVETGTGDEAEEGVVLAGVPRVRPPDDEDEDEDEDGLDAPDRDEDEDEDELDTPDENENENENENEDELDDEPEEENDEDEL
jgi:DNA gyrase subunit A